jgi:hypothetical protein
MFRAIHRSLARLLLAVMLITFAAPGFGWQANATHDEIAHASDAHAEAHPHDHDGDASDHDDEAHGAIGHLLGHLPAFLSSSTPLPTVIPAHSQFAELTVQSPCNSPEPPLRPPRFS